MKLFDVRSLTKAPEKAVVWKMANAHNDVVRDLAWSPLMRYWVASAGQILVCLLVVG
jgi:WD40 repeat protein